MTTATEEAAVVRAVCPHCHKTNRVPAERLADTPKCGGCKQPLLEPRPFALTEANIDKHLENSDLPLVIDFWAPWCGPCRYEAPALEKLYVYFKARGVEFVGVAVQDSEEGVRGFIKKYDISYPVGMDDTEEISRSYMIYALPKTFVVDKDGRITYIRSGGISEEELTREIQRLL